MSFMCNFKGNYEIILSKERLSSYDNDIEAHFRNIKTIALITPKLATLEICLRNICDYLLCKTINENWLMEIDDEVVQDELYKICKKENKEYQRINKTSIHFSPYARYFYKDYKNTTIRKLYF